MIVRLKILLSCLVILSVLFSTSCITINEAPTLTSTSTSASSESKKGLAPLQSFVASPDYNPAVNITQIVQVQSQIDQLFEERYNIPYYDGLPELRKSYEPYGVNELQIALNDLKGLTQWNYEVNKFDCSNMSALTQFYLANAGFKTIMVLGTDAKLLEGHAWVVVLISGQTPEAIPIECTTVGGPAIPSKVKPNTFSSHGITDTQSYNDYLTGGWAVQDLYQAAAWAQQNNGETLGSDNEFNWWDTTQVNWSLLLKTATLTTTSVTNTNINTITSIQSSRIIVNPLSVSTGATVTIAGQGFTPNGVISTLGITIGGMIGNAESISMDANGSFSYSLILSALPKGTYTVKCTDIAGKTASGTITVTTPQTTPPPSLTLTPASGSPGSQFTVTGYNFTPLGTVKSADISWNSMPLTGSHTYSVDSTGNVAFTLILSTTQSPGNYTIVVTDSSGKSATTTFTVLTQTTTTTNTTKITTTATVLYPAIGAQNVPINLTFTWPAVAGAVSYEFALAQGIGAANNFDILDYSNNTPTNSITAQETLLYNTTYNWEFRAVNANGSKSAWTVGFFTTKTAPVATTTTK